VSYPVTLYQEQEVSSGIISCPSPATPRRLHYALVSASHSLTPHPSPSLSILGSDPGKRTLSVLWRSTPRTSHPRAYNTKSRAAREAFIKAMNDPVKRRASLYSNQLLKGPSTQTKASGTGLFKSKSCLCPSMIVELSCYDTLTRPLPSAILEVPNKTATVTQVSRPLLTLSQCFPTTLTRLPSTLPVLRTFPMILDQLHKDGFTNTGFTVLTRSTPSWSRSSTTRLTSIMTVSPL
jgi:hypothetical protein